MAYTSEIEKLERRFAENPTGRNFAPLADAYRKAGELDRAIELCQGGLTRHPDYVSAHIVYGRCLMDQKNVPAAEQAFKRVLALDPENIIGLKVLADIAERHNRFDEAVDWLTKLLAADPMNGDAAEALARAKGKAAAVAKTTALVVEIVPEPKADFVVEHTSVPEAAPTAATAAPAPEIETFDGTVDFNAAAHDAAKAEGLEVEAEVVLKPHAAPIEGLARTHEPEVEEEELPKIDLPLIMPEDVTPRAPAPPPPPPPPRSPPPAPAAPVPAAALLSEDDGAADSAALSRAEPVVTETMAELYLKQGHQEDALRVYQALLAQRPGDAMLKAKIKVLTGGKRGAAKSSGQSAGAFLKSILRGEGARMAGASTLDSAFAAAPGGPAPEESEPAPGEPSYPADEAISLDQVFGEDAARASAPAVEPPSSGAAATGGFSFDDFFSSKAAPGAPPAAGSPPGPQAPPPAGEENNLDHFQAWLKRLKS